MGRPSSYTQQTADAICEAIVNGQSIRRICDLEGMPSMSTLFKWLRENDDFSEQYARAKDTQAEVLADEIIEIADGADKENAQAVRVQVDARKWVAAKLLPKKYGERQTIEHEGKIAVPLDLGQLDTETLRKLADAAGSSQ